MANEDRQRIGEYVFGVAWNIAGSTLSAPDRMFLTGTMSVTDNMTWYGLWVRRQLYHLRSQDSALRPPSIAPLEERFLKIILLFKLMQQLNPAESAELRVAHHAVGAMLQQDLMLLLAEVRLEQWNRLFNLRKLPGIGSEWSMHMAGASAATYTLLALAMRDESKVFLPTGYEDVHLGIDLFWLEQSRFHAVSVKCVTGQNLPVRAWRVDEQPNTDTSDRLSIDLLNIFDGAHYSRLGDRPCIPVLVYVAKPKGGPIQLEQDWRQLTWPDQLLGTRHPVSFTDDEQPPVAAYPPSS